MYTPVENRKTVKIPAGVHEQILLRWRKTGESATKIAAAYGVSESSVHRIISKRFNSKKK